MHLKRWLTGIIAVPLLIYLIGLILVLPVIDPRRAR